jgi:hypothetical protein
MCVCLILKRENDAYCNNKINYKYIEYIHYALIEQF